MRVFVTGATGFVGSAVVQDLQAAGYDLVGLARSEDAAAALHRADVQPHPGALDDPDSLASGARLSDAVIHTAFIHDFSRYQENAEIDRRAVEAMAAALAGSGKPFLAVSVTTLVAPGRTAVETDPPADQAIPRAASEAAVLGAAAKGVCAAAVRFPPSVHGAGDRGGFVPGLINIARRRGISAYVGEGGNVWPAVHRLDVARLFRLGLEKAEPGQRWHAVADRGVAFRDIAEAIGQGLGLPVRSLKPEAAQDHFGWMARFATTDNPASSERTRDRLGWRPQEPGLLEDLPAAGYFD